MLPSYACEGKNQFAELIENILSPLAMPTGLVRPLVRRDLICVRGDELLNGLERIDLARPFVGP